MVVVLIGIIIYAFLNARREDSGQIPDPVDNPPDDAAASAPAPVPAPSPADAGPEAAAA